MLKRVSEEKLDLGGGSFLGKLKVKETNSNQSGFFQNLATTKLTFNVY